MYCLSAIACKGKIQESAGTLDAGTLASRRMYEFNAKKLTVIPSNRCRNPKFGLTLLWQRECQLISWRERQVADHAGADARKVSHPS